MNETEEEGENIHASARAIQLPEQKTFFKIPARFGHVPVAEEPLDMIISVEVKRENASI